MTRRRLSLWQVTLVVFLAALVYFTSFLRYGLAYDEGYLLDSVERILDGQVIYRDFHHTYAPGSFYLMAALFKAFGRNILVERWVFAVLEAAKCSLAFLICSAAGAGSFALLAPILMAVAPGPWHKVFFPAFGFLSLYAVLVAIKRRSRWYLGAGAAIGISAIFRQDVAGFAVVGLLVGIAIEEVHRRDGPGPVLRGIAWLACGLALTVGPVCLYFLRQGALGAMVHKLTVDGVLDNMTNRIAYPGLAARTGIDWHYIAHVAPVKLLFYLPFVAYLGAVVLVARALFKRYWTSEHTAFTVVLVASGLAFDQSTFRADIGHLFQTLQYVFLLVPIVLASGPRWIGRRFRLGSGGGLALTCGLAALSVLALFWATLASVAATTDPQMAGRFQSEGLSVGDSEYIGSVLVRIGNTTRLGLERAPIYVTPGEARFFMQIRRFLDANTSAGDYVLAVHQLQMLYFLYGRKNPTRYAHYRRRLSPAEEKRYIDDIVSHGTVYILLTEPFEGARIGQTSESFSEYAKPVRDWILANYVAVDRIGWVKVLRRRQ